MITREHLAMGQAVFREVTEVNQWMGIDWAYSTLWDCQRTYPAASCCATMYDAKLWSCE